MLGCNNTATTAILAGVVKILMLQMDGAGAGLHCSRLQTRYKRKNAKEDFYFRQIENFAGSDGEREDLRGIRIDMVRRSGTMKINPLAMGQGNQIKQTAYQVGYVRIGQLALGCLV